MTTRAVILCDERDVAIAEAIRAAIEGRGGAAAILLCDASEEALGSGTREALAGAAAIVVVLREGGRGTRLLRAAEDEAQGSATVLPLMADASPGAAVSARTEARVRTLVDTLEGPAGVARGVASKKSARASQVAMAVAAAAAVLILGVVLALRFWPSGPAPLGGPSVSLSGMLSNTGWIVTFHLREEASRIDYKRPGDPDFISTGDTGLGVGADLGKPRAKTFVVLKDIRGRVPFLVRYTTLNGAERGPYEAVFDTTAEAVSSVKRVLASVPEWVSFRDFNGRTLCYFTTLVAHKYALQSIRYGIDTDAPNRTVRFAPSDGPGVQSDDELYIDLPGGAASVTVELLFLDGTSAGPKRFPVR